MYIICVCKYIRLPISELVLNFQEVIISSLPASQIASCQSKLPHVSVAVAPVFVVGERVLYTSQIDLGSSTLAATIVGVHHDDFPNVYYTVTKGNFYYFYCNFSLFICR